jgi:cell wall-associated NlpC family hydrolase
MAANAATVRAQLAERQRVLDGLDASIKTLIAQQQARKAAAARAKYMAYLAKQKKPTKRPTSKGGQSWLDLGGNPPSSAKAAVAVAWAKKALGRRYVWAASGPVTFDCSGLTMWAYSHAGVSLPHSSRAQISYGRRVSKANLQPGDLVFFYSPIHHVGMYVGGGYFIHAPGTGRAVQYQALASYRGFAGACRP